MERLSHPFFPLLIIIPLLMSVLAFLKHLRYRKLEFLHLGEFYLSMSLVAVASWVLLPMGAAFVVLSMLPWIWTLRTYGLIVEDVSKELLFNRFHYIVLGLGGLVSIVFLTFDYSLPLVTAPFALSVGLIGLTFIFQAYSRQGRSYGYLHHFNFLLVLAYFVSRLAYPMLISSPGRIYLTAVIDGFLLLGLSATLYPLYAELIFERHERFLEEILHTRNRQLFSHSGFSEYKILSAGISHEVNNALSVINARIALLLRGKSREPEKDLRTILNSSNRIVKSMKGLREFIYPLQLSEVLDLGEVVRDVLALYGQRLSNHGVRVDVNGLAGKLVKGQRVQVEQVFLSLINNSVDTLDRLEEKWISIFGRGNDGHVEINYQDSSPSKAESIVPLLEDPFYSVQEFMDNDIRLILAKEIVEKHSGTLHCVSAELSTFHIVLPLAQALRSTQMDIQSKIEEINELH